MGETHDTQTTSQEAAGGRPNERTEHSIAPQSPTSPFSLSQRLFPRTTPLRIIAARFRLQPRLFRRPLECYRLPVAAAAREAPTKRAHEPVDKANLGALKNWGPSKIEAEEPPHMFDDIAKNSPRSGYNGQHGRVYHHKLPRHALLYTL